MNDAGDVLLTLYERVMAVSQEGGAINSIFGLPLTEHVRCHSCGLTTQQSSYMQYFHNTQARAGGASGDDGGCLGGLASGDDLHLLPALGLRMCPPLSALHPALRPHAVPATLQAAALHNARSFSSELSMGNLLKLIEQQTMKTCDTVGASAALLCCWIVHCARCSLPCVRGFHSRGHLSYTDSLPPLQHVGGCGMKNSVVHTLDSLPLVFTLQLGWSSHREEPHSIAGTLANIDETVRAGRGGAGCCQHCAVRSWRPAAALMRGLHVP